MTSLLILPRIKVEAANAISGIVYGFPAVTHFLGYVHAISRELNAKFGVKLGGCGIISHNHQIHAYQNGGGGENVFSLTRNPLKKTGETSSFNEEGRIHLEVSLVVECDFTVDDIGDEVNQKQEFENLIYRLSVKKRLAGGIITEMSPVKFYEFSQDEEKARFEFRRVLRKLLPGFVLRDRSDVFEEHLSKYPDLNPMDAMLDFYALKYRAAAPLSNTLDLSESKANWELLPKPCHGWIVPIQSGYKAISPTYEGGKVDRVRDPNVPFRFVEPVYGLGEWMGLHRIQNMDSILWRYQHAEDFYVCSNKKKERN